MDSERIQKFPRKFFLERLGVGRDLQQVKFFSPQKKTTNDHMFGVGDLEFTGRKTLVLKIPLINHVVAKALG